LKYCCGLHSVWPVRRHGSATARHSNNAPWFGITSAYVALQFCLDSAWNGGSAVGWFILGILLIAAAGILYAVSQSNKRQSLALAITDMMPVGDPLALYDKVSAEVGKGAFVQRVTVQGTLECDQPLQAELSNAPCVAFRQRVERRYEEEYEEQDGDGNRVRRTREGSESVSSNEGRTPFAVRDDTGRVAVALDGADLEMVTTVDRFEPGNPGMQGGMLQLGGFQLNLGGFNPMEGRRTLGYHFHEEIVPVGRTVYVLGSATDAGGSLAIGTSHQRHEPFLVSLRNREQLLQSAKQTMAYTLYGAMGSAALGGLLVIVGLLSRK
jgi:E3 Ubiquitin ligase